MEREIDFSVSTGANHLDDSMIEMFNAAAEKVQFNLQLSLEPEVWGLRITHGGEHIMSVLRRNETLRKLRYFHVNTVIPTSYQVPRVGYVEYLEEIVNHKGDWNFSASFFPEANEDCERLPAFFDEWEAECMSVIHSNPDRFLNKSLYFMAWEYLPFVRGSPYRYSNCDIAQSTAMGPDGEIYSCHEQAVDLDPNWKKGPGHENLHKASVHKWSKMMDNPDCRSCPAHFVCGGVCYKHEVGKRNSQCQFWARAAEKMFNYVALKHPKNFMPTMAALDAEFERVSGVDGIDAAYDEWTKSESFAAAEVAAGRVR